MGGERTKLTQSQKRLAQEIKERMRNAMAAAEAQDDETLEAYVATAATNRILFANGPPGTGKTYCGARAGSPLETEGCSHPLCRTDWTTGF